MLVEPSDYYLGEDHSDKLGWKGEAQEAGLTGGRTKDCGGHGGASLTG